MSVWEWESSSRLPWRGLLHLAWQGNQCLGHFCPSWMKALFLWMLGGVSPSSWSFLPDPLPLLSRGINLVLFADCSWWRSSSTTIFLRSVVVTLCQVGSLASSPKPPLPCWTCPMMSLCLGADVAWCTASDGVHFRPVDRGSAAFFWWPDLWSPSNHLESYFGALVFLHQTDERKFKDSFSIEADVAAALRHTRPFLSGCGDGWRYGDLIDLSEIKSQNT